MIDRSEKVGLAVAAAGHVLLFGVLSVGFLATPNPLKLESRPVEVMLIDDVALEMTAPQISSEEPAAKLAPEDAPLEPEAAPPEPTPAPPEPQPKPPEPAPQPPKPAPPKPVPPKPVAKTAPAPKAKPQPPAPSAPAKPATPAKPAASAPAKSAAAPARPSNAAPAKPTGRLDGIVSGLTDKPTQSKVTTPPASAIGPQVKAALSAEILRQIKPKWQPPSGADSDKLRTTVQVRLKQDGSIDGEPRVTQTGVTDGNRVQAGLHRERAIRAVKLAAPFKLPAQYYDAWKTIAPTLYEGL